MSWHDIGLLVLWFGTVLFLLWVLLIQFIK
jgi:hypothetical protein